MEDYTWLGREYPMTKGYGLIILMGSNWEP
jgi:hypothetical protein